jgi:ATP-dependent exoDNAse (exonuclease V) beta subunit
MTETAIPADRISLVTAGAGSGKTYRITQDVLGRLDNGMPADGLLATTFTRKAAAELQERIQTALIAAGRHDDALAAQYARIGTVNAVCGRLLQDFALEAGLSPELTVIDEEGAKAAFLRAIDQVAVSWQRRLASALYRLGLDSSDEDGWLKYVREIAETARINRLGPAELKAAATESIASATALLGAADDDGDALDTTFENVIDALLAAADGWDLEAAPQNTRNAISALQEFRRTFDPTHERFGKWADWVRISRLAPAAARRENFAPMLAAAAAHDRHPRLRADITALISASFEIADLALDRYAAFKRKAGVVDFIDQETLVLDLLERNPEVRRELSTQLDTVMVDEFQDTSPLQLALFLRLSSLARQAVWVGDPKQAIFGFRGADPALMEAAIAALGADAASILETSRRSRPHLVDLVNVIFVPAFAAQDMAAERVRLKAHRQDHPEHVAPLAIWHVPGKNAGLRTAALAAAVERLLADPERPMIEDRATGTMRRVRGGDIAILCRTNGMIGALAHALSARGLAVATERGGLLGTSEIRLTLAVLRRFADGRDRLAAAEIVHLTDPSGDGGWLTDMIQGKEPDDPRLDAIDGARNAFGALPPVTALGELIGVAKLMPVFAAWPNSAQRCANLDAIYKAAVDYEEESREAARAATVQGFIAWLGERADSLAQPATIDDDSVTLLTYHRSKGLEWPAVIMTETGKRFEPRVFGVSIENDDTAFSIEDPLAARSLRYWPWPYGRQGSNTALLDRANTSAVAIAASEREEREAVRLGYVGMTRARDLLIVAIDPGKPEWLNSYAPDFEAVCRELPVGAGTLRYRDAEIPVVRWDLPPATEAGAPDRDDGVEILAWPSGHSHEGAARRLNPSQTTSDFGVGSGIVMEKLGPRLAYAGGVDRAEVGEAFHRFLAADNPSRPSEERRALAARLDTSFGAGLDPADFVAAADRLWDFLRDRYGAGAEWLREWPVRLLMDNGQELHGRIDLLVRHDSGFAVIDHKSFPGRDAETHAANHLGQLGLYARAITTLTSRPVTECLVHMPILGLIGIAQGHMTMVRT